MALSKDCLTKREITLFSPPSLCQLRSYGTLDGSLPQTSLRPSEGRRQVPHVAAAGAKVHLEHNGDFVVLGYAPEHSMRGHGRRCAATCGA